MDYIVCFTMFICTCIEFLPTAEPRFENNNQGTHFIPPLPTPDFKVDIQTATQLQATANVIKSLLSVQDLLLVLRVTV